MCRLLYENVKCGEFDNSLHNFFEAERKLIWFISRPTLEGFGCDCGCFKQKSITSFHEKEIEKIIVDDTKSVKRKKKNRKPLQAFYESTTKTESESNFKTRPM